MLPANIQGFTGHRDVFSTDIFSTDILSTDILLTGHIIDGTYFRLVIKWDIFSTSNKIVKFEPVFVHQQTIEIGG